ncbi:MAG: glycosyltransferase family 9 protein [Gammaproteobacteria bacterium]|nr:glycosyltransferase family 9 protein [Gammaproteobacteria bacterium]
MCTDLKKILVIRNDKLGDFMLSWPALALLRQALPHCEIHVLVNSYTADMARLCPSINQTIIDPGPQAPWLTQWALARSLRDEGYDAAVTLFSTTRIGAILALAGIPYRLAPATKIAQIFYHVRLTQRRSRSEKPEFAYNQDLALRLLGDFGITSGSPPTPPYLRFAEEELTQLRNDFCLKHRLDSDKLLVFIHPGSGGSANNLSLEQYAQLAQTLHSSQGHQIIISTGPSELAPAQQLAAKIGDMAASIYHSTAGLEQFARHIAIADLFISGSTGPLHIAGALDRPTAAFYPRRRSATALRWQTTNRESRRLTFSPPESAAKEDMSSIDIKAAAHEISNKLLSVGQP